MKKDPNFPCTNCITLSVCLARGKAIKERYIEEGLIGDDNMMVDDERGERFNQFDADIVNELSFNCELFSEYFPYTDASGSIQYPHWFIMDPQDDDLSEEEWLERAEHFQDMFGKDYPKRDDGEKRAIARQKERERIKKEIQEKAKFKRQRQKRKAKKRILKFD